jgi:cysteinyl-tRNA synthetase
MLSAINRFADAKKLEAGKPDASALADFKQAAVILKEMSQILGVFLKPVQAETEGSDKLMGGVMQLLIDLRAEARKSKNFALADQIRQRLSHLGITIEDRPGGTGWRVG